MPKTIAELGGKLERIGWRTDVVEFGRVTWIATHSTGTVTIGATRTVNGGTEGFCAVTTNHDDDGEEDLEVYWPTEDLRLTVTAARDGINRPEAEVADTLWKYAGLVSIRLDASED